jgi:hypothetical protein
VLALPDVFHFFPHKLAGLCGRRLSGTRILTGTLDGSLLRRMYWWSY